MTGTNAYAVLGDQGVRRARVLDLGFGGVAMELDSAEDLPENLLAVLHVPILPPVRSLKEKIKSFSMQMRTAWVLCLMKISIAILILCKKT